MPRLKIIVLSLGLLLFAGLFSIPAVAGIKVGDVFPELSSFKLEGKLPETTRGKVVMIDFWASWCDPCKDSFPAMADLQKKYADKDFIIIAINVDENRSDMDDFLKKNVAGFIVVRDATQKLVEKAGIGTMPSAFLIDQEGKVRFTHGGYRGAETKKKYAEEIESLLKK
jgi:thiol-disulfide isomerase/thioredoxin